MTPDLDAETRAVTARVIMAAQRSIPRLSVTLTPHTRGKQWLADTCCARIWLSNTLPAEAMVAALHAAIAAVETHQRRLMSLVPVQRCAEPVPVD